MKHPIKAGDGSNSGLVLLEKKTVHWPDALAEPQFSAFKLREQSKARTMLGVPVQREAQVVAVLFLARTTVKPFTERQIELVNTFADQAVIAIENTRLFEEAQARTRDATEALEYQTATSDVLEAISRSPTDAQPVFETIAQSAARLCNAHFCNVFRFDGHLIHFAASYGASAEFRDEKRTQSPVVPSRGFAAARAILDNAVTEIADLRADPDFDHWRIASVADYRSVVAVPMRKDGLPIGAIAVVRSQIGAFPKRQIELLNTFADQAVIAIENTRLFEAEQAGKRDLQESLEYQTAISEVLGVISRSPTNVQPVFDTIASSALHLCAGTFSSVFRFDGRLIHFAAAHGMTPEGFEALRCTYPLPPGRAGATTRAIETGAIAEIPDINADLDFEHHHVSLEQNSKSLVSVLMLKDGRPIGTITVGQAKTGRFPKRQIALLRTFADQAVIAIENTRLFEAEQASKRELTESLEQQTATADVLKVISRSALDVQKVLDALVESAARLCDAYDAAIFQVFGESLRLVAHHGQIPFAGPVGQHTLPLVRGLITGRAVIDRRTIQVADMQAEAEEYPEDRSRALQLGWRTALVVPLIHAGEAIGLIAIRRTEVRPFTERQIELVRSEEHTS